MNASNKEISEQFSQGNFSFCYEYMSDNIKWNIIGSETKNGKQQVVAFCDKMLKEMASSTLTNTNTIATDNYVAIEGYCDYTDADNKPGKLSYCDVYRFENNMVASITSYCIDKKQ